MSAPSRCRLRRDARRCRLPQSACPVEDQPAEVPVVPVAPVIRRDDLLPCRCHPPKREVAGAVVVVSTTHGTLAGAIANLAGDHARRGLPSLAGCPGRRIMNSVGRGNTTGVVGALLDTGNGGGTARLLLDDLLLAGPARLLLDDLLRVGPARLLLDGRGRVRSHGPPTA